MPCTYRSRGERRAMAARLLGLTLRNWYAALSSRVQQLWGMFIFLYNRAPLLISIQIWSIRFSGDGREIVAGTSARSVHVYDIESRQSVLSIEGHGDDVNAVCFGDTSSPHILYSGSDDTLIKVWDRRSMGDSREAGVFMGHTEGLTYVDSKGDGRYVLSNGKDQTMKLWDLRKMMSTEKASTINPSSHTTGFDYRFMNFYDEEYKPHPHDCSLVTYRGHSVLKTLIRCHFSPPGSTNSRYVYSGSEDGSVYIYNMDATLAGKIDVKDATQNSRPRDPDLYASSMTYDMDDDRSSGSWKTCVRDASWHPNAPVIAGMFPLPILPPLCISHCLLLHYYIPITTMLTNTQQHLGTAGAWPPVPARPTAGTTAPRTTRASRRWVCASTRSLRKSTICTTRGERGAGGASLGTCGADLYRRRQSIRQLGVLGEEMINGGGGG